MIMTSPGRGDPMTVFSGRCECYKKRHERRCDADAGADGGERS